MSDNPVSRAQFESEMERRHTIHNLRTETEIQLDWCRQYYHQTSSLIVRMVDSNCSADSKKAYRTIIKERIESQVREVSDLQGYLMRLLNAIEK
jgi:hypothetical protein